MKNRLLLLIILVFPFVSISQVVPNTETFSLADVVYVIAPTSNTLYDCFEESNAAYFDPAYGSKTMSPRTLLGFRNYDKPGGTNIPITYINSTSSEGLTSSTINIDATIDSDATFLVVSITTVSNGFRQLSIPKWNNVNLYQVGSNNGSSCSEMWYIPNPAVGARRLVVENSTTANINITIAWYKSSGRITLYSYNTKSDYGTDVRLSMPTRINTGILVTDALTVTATSPYVFSSSFNSNILLAKYGEGTSFGSITQYDVAVTTLTSITSRYTISSDYMLWYYISAVFAST